MARDILLLMLPGTRTATDPQVEVNVLIKLLRGVPEFVAYAQARQVVGLSYNVAAQAEFLASGSGTPDQLTALEQQHGIRLIQDVSLAEIAAAAVRLLGAFHGDRLGRSLRMADAQIAATAFLKGEPLATGDLQFYKRGKDLGLVTGFVCSGRAATRAAAYSPIPVTVPP